MFTCFQWLCKSVVLVVFISLNLVNATPIASTHIEMLAGLPKPPFIIQENGSGLQLDLLREAFLTVDKQVSFIHTPMGRNLSGFERLQSDGIATIPANTSLPNMFVSKPYVTYQNVAVSLTAANLNITSAETLRDKNVIAFQNAKKFLDKEYQSTVCSSSKYREFADQKKQIAMLFSQRTDVIILDINIFKHFLANNKSAPFNQPYDIHYIFQEKAYSAGFRDPQLRNVFDLGIERIKAQGTYQRVLDKYLN